MFVFKHAPCGKSALTGDDDHTHELAPTSQTCPIASLYNCPIEDQKNYVDGDNSGFVSSTGVFGRRYYRLAH